jgi:hypothetical protein
MDIKISEKYDVSIFRVEACRVRNRLGKRARCKEHGHSDPREGMRKLLQPRGQQSEDGKVFTNGE